MESCRLRYKMSCMLAFRSEFSQAELDDLHRHAESCSACRARMGQSLELNALLLIAQARRIPDRTVPPGMLQRFVTRAEREGILPVRTRSAPSRWFPSRLPSWIPAAGLAVLVMAMLLWSTGPSLKRLGKQPGGDFNTGVMAIPKPFVARVPAPSHRALRQLARNPEDRKPKTRVQIIPERSSPRVSAEFSAPAPHVLLPDGMTSDGMTTPALRETAWRRQRAPSLSLVNFLDPEESPAAPYLRIHLIGAPRFSETLRNDPFLKWPDGSDGPPVFSFDPEIGLMAQSDVPALFNRYRSHAAWTEAFSGFDFMIDSSHLH